MKAMQTLLFAVFAALIGIAQAQPVPAATATRSRSARRSAPSSTCT